MRSAGDNMTVSPSFDRNGILAPAPPAVPRVTPRPSFPAGPSARACYEAGLRAQQAGDVSAAEAAYRTALRLDARHAPSACNLGVLILERNSLEGASVVEGPRAGLYSCTSAGYEQALRLFDQAIAADPAYLVALLNRATVLWALCRFGEAEQSATAALRLRCGHPDAWTVLGLCAQERGDYRRALHCYERALASAPGHVEAHCNRGMCWLTLGEYGRGWRDYELRHRTQVVGMRDRPHYTEPEWDGSTLDGRTILLYTEQGFGDTIQFARFARELKRRWRVRIVLECADTLVPLFRTCAWADAVVPRGAPLPPFDVQLSLLSLPFRLGVSLADIDGAPYLEAQARPVAARVRESSAMKVGIVWSGRAPNPHLARRSLPLAQLAPLAEIPGAELYSLQVGDGSAQLVDSPLAGRVTDLAPDLRDFVDTAVVLARLDLVITIDSAVAHLAGALGVPTWVLLIHAADWRWGVGGPSTPWYHPARLFRQPAPGDWTSVVADVRRALEDLVLSRRGPREEAA